MQLAKYEAEKYERVWEIPQYSKHSPGEEYAEMFMQISRAKPGNSVIDLGCGEGRGGLKLRKRGLDVSFLDHIRLETPPEPYYCQSLWQPLMDDFEFGYCCDVMEHIPTQFTMLVAHNLLQSCRAVFFSISFQPDGFGRFIGEPLHLTVQPYTWWRDSLAELGHLVEARDLLGEGVFYVQRR